MNTTPLLAIVLPITLVLSAIAIYRSLYPYERVRRATEIVAEYRVLKSRARSKKDLKRLRVLESEYREARRLVFRALIVKLVLLLSGYVSGSIILLVAAPVLLAPFHLPPLTVAGEEGYYMLSITAYFLVYVALFIVLRDSFL